ncbi:unnamed protein product [Rhizoctonia solani]|uniref:Uncharacterized protein n=1 Tax=Rhizoctonia solani TaxID=456999 RepID=A0A8H2WNW5_9AGAM|nr:unnamed protein product [Rhizoctonia solani]
MSLPVEPIAVHLNTAGLASESSTSDASSPVQTTPGSPPADQNNKFENLDNDIDTSTTNNRADDHIDQQTVAGASGKRVANLTRLAFPTLKIARGRFSSVYKGVYRKHGSHIGLLTPLIFPKSNI